MLRAPWGELTYTDFFEGTVVEALSPLNPPRNVNVFGQEAWLYTTLSAPSGSILEIPGQLFNYVDVWFRFPDGVVIHDQAGDRYPYVEKTVKHAAVAFSIPGETSGTVDVLIRMKNITTHPMHFVAWIWPEDDWRDYVLAQRTWYAFFMGAIAALCIYNLFLAISFRDISYLFYVGYILCLTFSVILCSGLAEEFLWPSGKPAPFILAATGLGTFLGVGFVNTFLKIHDRYFYAYWWSTALSGLACILGVMSIFSYTLPLVPEVSIVRIVHGLLFLGGFYFIAISIIEYVKGVTHARFLALGMLVMLPSTAFYFMYTSAYISYNLVAGHFLELGALGEGLILSLALADRINLLSADKLAAENAAREYQMKFSKAVITTQERERQEFSQKMHDSIGHGLLVLKNNLQQAATNLSDGNSDATIAAADLLASQIDYCGEIMGEVRDLSHDLHPHMLARLGLVAAVESTIERAMASSGAKVDIDIDDLPDDIEPEIQITAYRVIQECLSNILKYAEATEVSFRIRMEPETIEVRIADNGRGFDLNKNNGKTLGLLEMEGRVRLLGGHLEAASEPGGGTVVQFGVPYKSSLNNFPGAA